MKITAAGIIAIVIAFAAIAAAVSAQQPGFTRTVIRQADLSVPGREVVTAIAQFQPGATAGWHTHPGEEVGYLMEGTFVFEMEGKPAMTLSAGQTFFVPPGIAHNATNKGAGTTRVLATYIVEKGKPLASPAAAK